ncbi:MAG: flagellar biosynthesis protein FlgE [Sulfurospirillum sp.]|nr:flagellar biosynthesis protein FlgE [Sulfurospirillum sp.]
MQINANSMQAYNNWMSNNANNVANLNTQDYQATNTTMQSAGANSVVASSSKSNNATDLAKEMSEQINIQGGFEANATAIKTKDQMLGSLLDLNA